VAEDYYRPRVRRQASTHRDRLYGCLDSSKNAREAISAIYYRAFEDATLPAVYAASLLSNENMRQAEVSDVADVSEVAICNL
jgi:hypothetical protein